MLAIYKKELRSYFINPIGYVFLGIFLAVSALLCCYTTIVSGTYDTSNYFFFLTLTFVILIPLLTMRLFAEEKKLRTEQLLLTAPVSITGMVLGKFLAAFTIFGGAMIVSCINFIPLYVTAAIERPTAAYEFYRIGPATGEIVGCVVCLILIGAAFIAIGTFISSLTENQLAAAVITITVIFAMLGISLLNNYISVYWLRTVLSWVSVYSRFAPFANGIFDFASILYLVSLSFAFLFLTVRVYEKRRWS